MPLNLKNLPHEGYSDRENSDAINQIIQFAVEKIDNSFTATAAALAAGAVTILDVKIKSNSKIILQSTNADAVVAAVYISDISEGSFDITATVTPPGDATWDYIVI